MTAWLCRMTGSMTAPTRTIFLLFLVLMATTYGLCPDKCLCKWKGGKETVECINSSLTRFPALDSTTQVMDLSYNNLVKLQKDTFSSLNLLNLQKIYLRQCSLHVVLGRCFRGMTNLVELDLSFNLLQTVPEEALTDCEYLMVLNLAGNPIRRVTQKQLAPLKHLQTLDLSSCQIVEVDAKAFADLTNLHWLKLDNNLLETIDPGIDLPKKTKGVSFNGNRWKCDCKLIGLRDFLQNKTVSFQIDPLCFHPDWISGQVIRELGDSELACLPQLTPTASFEEVISGKNMSLVCTVDSLPLSRITWRYRGLLLNNGSTMVSDIDLRTYLYFNTLTGHNRVTSELVIQRTSPEDSGVFQCEAENRAGSIVGNFTVSVVRPVPPDSPKETKVEERLKQEYFVLIGVSAVIISILTIAVSMIFIIKCRRGGRRNHPVPANPQLYQSSGGESSFSSDKTLMKVHSSRMNCFVESVSSSDYSASYIRDDLSYQQMMEDCANVKDPMKAYTRSNCILKKTFTSFGDHVDEGSGVVPFKHIILSDAKRSDILRLSSETDGDASSDVSAVKEDTVEQQVPKLINLGSEEPDKNQESRSSTSTSENHWHFSTLPRKTLLKVGAEGVSSPGTLSRNLKHYAPIRKREELILPPPPQFKGVHFEAGMSELVKDICIPREGLPTLPAVQKVSTPTE